MPRPFVTPSIKPFYVSLEQFHREHTISDDDPRASRATGYNLISNLRSRGKLFGLSLSPSARNAVHITSLKILAARRILNSVIACSHALRQHSRTKTWALLSFKMSSQFSRNRAIRFVNCNRDSEKFKDCMAVTLGRPMI